MIYLKLTDSGTDYYQRQWAIFLSQIISKCLMRWCGRDSITGLGTGISEVRCLPFSTFILRNHLTSLSISVHRILVSLVPSWESLTWPVYSLPWVGWSVSLPTGHACDSYQSNKQLQNGAEASVTKRVSLSQIAIFFFFFSLLATPCNMQLFVFWLGIELMSAAVECEILTTGLQGKSWLANLKP